MLMVKLWLGGLLLAAPLAQAALDPEAELEETRAAIGDLERSLEERRAALEILEERTASAARGTRESRREMRALDQARAEQAERIAAQQARVDAAEADLDAARKTAAGLVRDQWQQGRHPGRVPGGDAGSRHAPEFAQRVRAAREQALAAVQARIDRLRAARAALEREQAVLEEQRARTQELVTQLEREEAAQRAAQAEVEAALEDEALRLDRLRRNAETLEALIEDVRSRQAERPREGGTPEHGMRGPEVGFAQLRGELPRPVEGSVVRSFNSSRAGRLRSRWRGAVLEVEGDSTARAVHGGEVVYADWMQGYGFLVILNHGGGYLTLYSNLAEVLVAEQQAVSAGAPIGVAGEASAAIAPGLYFEIRENGRPVNPEDWWPSQ